LATLQQVIDQKMQVDYSDPVSSPLRLDSQLVREIQTILSRSGFYQEPIDGIFGRFTQAALRDFKEARNLSGGDVLGPTTASLLLHARDTRVGNVQPQSRSEAQQAIISECRRLGMTMNTQIAYVLATTEHETANTFMPVEEAFFLGSKADAFRRTLDFFPYYGRGYVQLTHRANYAKYSNLLNADLVGHPSLALEPRIAMFVLIDGMMNGRFTGRKLGEFVNSNRTDFVQARRVVNGLDRAEHIAQIAQGWLKFLEKAMAPA